MEMYLILYSMVGDHWYFGAVLWLFFQGLLLLKESWILLGTKTWLPGGSDEINTEMVKEIQNQYSCNDRISVWIWNLLKTFGLV